MLDKAAAGFENKRDAAAKKRGGPKF